MWFDIEHVRDAARLDARGGRTTRCSPRATTGSSPTGRRRPTPAPSHHRRTRRAGRARRCSSGSPASCPGPADAPADAPRAPAHAAGRRRRAGRCSPTCRRWPSSPGRMPADTKLYLYLDPGRLIGDAPVDVRRPPVRRLGAAPDHRLPVAAGPVVLARRHASACPTGSPTGCGSARCSSPPAPACCGWPAGSGSALGRGARRRRSSTSCRRTSCPYVSRTSAMLLPWAGLGWIVGLTVARGDPHPVARRRAVPPSSSFTVGAVNATALVMIAPAPVLWLRRAPWPSGRSRGAGRSPTAAAHRRCCRSACRCGGSSMLAIQGRQGADVLAYSESLEVGQLHVDVDRGVARPRLLADVRPRRVRRDDDRRRATTWSSGRLIVAGFVLAARRPGRARASPAGRTAGSPSLLVVTGVVLGVGVHPIDDPSPLMDAAARRRHVGRRAGAALEHPGRAAADARPRPRRRRARRRARLRCASPGRVSWRPRGRGRASALLARRQPPGAHRAPPRRPGPRPRRGPAGGVDRRRRRARRRRRRRTACCSCRARSSARSAGATPSIRRCPG